MEWGELQGETNRAAGIGHQDMLNHKLRYKSAAPVPVCDACGSASEMLQTRQGCPGLFLCDACSERPLEWVQTQMDYQAWGEVLEEDGAEEGVSEVVDGAVGAERGADSFLAESAAEVQARQAATKRWRVERPQEEVGDMLEMEYLCGNTDCTKTDAGGVKLLRCSRCKSIKYCRYLPTCLDAAHRPLYVSHNLFARAVLLVNRRIGASTRGRALTPGARQTIFCSLDLHVSLASARVLLLTMMSP
jgi:hypothetical protein